MHEIQNKAEFMKELKKQEKSQPNRLVETGQKYRFILARMSMQMDAITRAHDAIQLGMEKYTLLIENLRVNDSKQLNKQMVVLTVI